MHVFHSLYDTIYQFEYKGATKNRAGALSCRNSANIQLFEREVKSEKDFVKTTVFPTTSHLTVTNSQDSQISNYVHNGLRYHNLSQGRRTNKGKKKLGFQVLLIFLRL